MGTRLFSQGPRRQRHLPPGLLHARKSPRELAGPFFPPGGLPYRALEITCNQSIGFPKGTGMLVHGWQIKHRTPVTVDFR